MSDFGRSHRLAAVLLLGFASGLPLALTGQALQAWLAIDGVNFATIGFFGLVGVPYTFKFLWAPLMDRFEPPWLGRRRGWLVLTQAGLALTLFAMSSLSPSRQPLLFVCRGARRYHVADVRTPDSAYFGHARGVLGHL